MSETELVRVWRGETATFVDAHNDTAVQGREEMIEKEWQGLVAIQGQVRHDFNKPRPDGDPTG